MPPSSHHPTAKSGRASTAWPLRRVHLDFHTSPLIPDVAREFDPQAFAATFKRAHVESVTVFAKCHHGMCYYPTRTGTAHPALDGRDLLGEMIEALHREGIQAPIYTTVAWEEDIADRFPEWRQQRADGTLARVGDEDSLETRQPGGWRFNEWTHPDYQDYIEAHVREILGRYDVDGFFFDILFHAAGAHCSAAAQKFRAKHGLTGGDAETFQRFEALAQDRFGARFTRLIRSRTRRATVFYNSGLDVSIDATIGGRVRVRHVTHLEIESLPSGFWGYYHFPRLARGASQWGQRWIGMTGRFQKMWGDFGGIKPQAALEFDCFRAQALGGGNSIGDQLPPRGTLDLAAYRLIAAVYAQCAAAEPFYAGSTALPQIGILTANHPARDAARTARADEAAVLMCEETHYEGALLDELADLSRFALLILPDETVITPTLRDKLRAYHRTGGKLLVSHRAGHDATGKWALDFLPLTIGGDCALFPTYWRARRSFAPEFADSDRVFYAQGLDVRRGRGTETLIDRVLPYFQRSDQAFSSHFQTPPVARPAPHPAVVAGANFVYFADPIFREYRESGNLIARDAWRSAMTRLIGAPPFAAGLPTTVLSVPRRRGTDLLLTLLHYVPVRKAVTLDLLEERMSFAGERLQLPPPAERVRVFGTNEELRRESDGSFLLPATKGRLLLEVSGFFRAPRR